MVDLRHNRPIFHNRLELWHKRTFLHHRDPSLWHLRGIESGGVAPVLSNATAVASGATTADLSVSTNDDTGTLYWVVTESASAPTRAQVKAGLDSVGAPAAAAGSQLVTTVGAQEAEATGLQGSTQYYAWFMHENAEAAQSAVLGSGSFTTDDVTAPLLSNASAVATGTATADLFVSTSEGTGTLYWVVTQSATAPSAAQVKLGQDELGTAADAAGSQAVNAIGAQSAAATGLAEDTEYHAYFMHEDAATNQSLVAGTDAFTTLVAGVFVTDFGDGTTDDWTTITGIVENLEEVGTVSGRVLVCRSGLGMGTWNIVPTAADIDAFAILKEVNPVGTGSSTYGIVARLQDSNNWYMAGLRNNGNGVRDTDRITSFINGSFGVVIQAPNAWDEGTYYNFRFQISGDTFRFRRWNLNDPQPGTWEIVTEMGIPDAGAVGLGKTSSSDGQRLHCQYLSVGINGAEPVIITIGAGFPDNTTGASEYFYFYG